MNLLIMGGPGAGKGTMSEKILISSMFSIFLPGTYSAMKWRNQTELGYVGEKLYRSGIACTG